MSFMYVGGASSHVHGLVVAVPNSTRKGEPMVITEAAPAAHSNKE